MIEIEHLYKRYGAFTALEDVHLRVDRGEIFGFLGPNGAGKTTTIRIMAGLIRPTSGTVRIAGMDVWRQPEAAKAVMSVIPDRPFLYEKLTGLEFMEFVARIYRMNNARWQRDLHALLDFFGLEVWKDELIENYSHGMRQRLVVAASVLPRPKIIVVDEPMVGLDPMGARLVKKLFRRQARQRGVSIFMSTHSLEMAEEMCDRIAILHRGRVIAMGTPEELRALAGGKGPDLESIFLALTGDEEMRGGFEALGKEAD